MKHEHEGIGLGINEGNDVFIEGHGIAIEGDGAAISKEIWDL